MCLWCHDYWLYGKSLSYHDSGCICNSFQCTWTDLMELRFEEKISVNHKTGGIFLNKLECYQRFSNSIRHFAKYRRLNIRVVLTVIWSKYFSKYWLLKRSLSSVVSLPSHCQYGKYFLIFLELCSKKCCKYENEMHLISLSFCSK